MLGTMHLVYRMCQSIAFDYLLRILPSLRNRSMGCSLCRPGFPRQFGESNDSIFGLGCYSKALGILRDFERHPSILDRLGVLSLKWQPRMWIRLEVGCVRDWWTRLSRRRMRLQALLEGKVSLSILFVAWFCKYIIAVVVVVIAGL